MTRPEDVLEFWLDKTEPKQWYVEDAGFDAEIRDRFEGAWQSAVDGQYALWLTYPTGALAYIILTDQFSRNMFRGSGKSFASDARALAVAKSAIEKGWDMKIDTPARQFFYLPLMHSESLSDQDRSVRLICERMGDGGTNLLHARAHREVIRQFGRFPYRNEALGRTSRGCEKAYLEAGGYGHTLRSLQQDQAA